MTDKGKFDKLFMHIVYENQGTIEFDAKRYAEILKNAHKTKRHKVILEDRDLLIDVPNELFDYCINHQEEVIPFSEIKNLLKSSKHYRNASANNPLGFCLFMFSFSDDLSIDSFHHKVFKIENGAQLDEARTLFKNTAKTNEGFLACIRDACYCAVDIDGNIEDTLSYELGHYLQILLGVRMTTSTAFLKPKDVIENKRMKNLEKLGLTLDKLIYFFNDKEFSIHVDRLSCGLLKTYLKNYRSLSVFEFIKLVYDSICSEDFTTSQLLTDYADANGNDIAPLMMYAGAKATNHKWQKIQHAVNTFLARKTKK